MESLNPKKAFTLLELIVVITIIGILVTIGTATYTTAQKKSRDEKRKSDLSDVRSALILYFQDFDKYPDSISDLVPDYLKTIPQDPIGITSQFDCNSENTYCYQFVTEEEFVLWAQLENTKDPNLSTNPSALCQNASPLGTAFNFCIQSPSL